MQRNNPDTSISAYKELKSSDQQKQHYKKILEALEKIGSGIYEKIAIVSGLEKHQVHRRLSEMERQLLVYKTKEKQPTSNNRKAYVYKIYKG